MKILFLAFCDLKPTFWQIMYLIIKEQCLDIQLEPLINKEVTVTVTGLKNTSRAKEFLILTK